MSVSLARRRQARKELLLICLGTAATLALLALLGYVAFWVWFAATWEMTF